MLIVPPSAEARGHLLPGAPAGRQPVRRGNLWVYEHGVELPVLQGGAVSMFWFGQTFTAAFNKEIDLGADTLKVMLLTGAATPNQDTWKYKSDVTNELPTGGGYTAGGLDLTGVIVSYTPATNVWAFDADPAVWGPGATITAHYAVVYDSTPATDATRPLLCCTDFGQDVPSSNGTYTIDWAAGGLAKVTVT